MKQQVVPRSGSSMTSRLTIDEAGHAAARTGAGRGAACRARCLRASRSAPHSSIATLASSDGCSCSGPRSIQRRAP